jgi:hypothetical protein
MKCSPKVSREPLRPSLRAHAVAGTAGMVVWLFVCSFAPFVCLFAFSGLFALFAKFGFLVCSFASLR